MVRPPSLDALGLSIDETSEPKVFGFTFGWITSVASVTEIVGLMSSVAAIDFDDIHPMAKFVI